ncbi:hypothetical protein GJ633_05365 [Halorubrum sp. CBA1125]|nr:hypothetical protein [Halorubrum sp. CBA1125]
MTVSIGGAAAGIGPVGGVHIPAVAQQQPETTEPTPAPETAVRLQANSAAISQSETATFDVVVESTDGGVGVYNFTVNLDEWSAASITDVSLQGNPPTETTNVSIAEDGSSANVTVARADTEDIGSVIIASVTVSPEDFGVIQLGLTVHALGTEAGESYVVTETTGASVEVIEVDPEPAVFAVSNLNAPASATQGEAIDVSAEISNEADEDGATKQVQFRLDLDGDGSLEADETLASQELMLNGSQTKTVTFSGVETSNIKPGAYTHGVVTEDDAATATITIEAVKDNAEPIADAGPDQIVDEGDTVTLDGTSSSDSDGDSLSYSWDTPDLGVGAVIDLSNASSPTPSFTAPEVDMDQTVTLELTVDDGNGGTDIDIVRVHIEDIAEEPTDGPKFTRDEIAQAKYGYDFAELSTETAGQVQAVYNRQPFPDGTQLEDLRTREEIATDGYGHTFGDLSRETTIAVQNTYDAQFGVLPFNQTYSRDEIAQAKYGYDFAELSTETAGQVQAVYNRQPFPDGTQLEDLRTREEIATDGYGHTFGDLSRETTITVQNAYDAQFDGTESE